MAEQEELSRGSAEPEQVSKEDMDAAHTLAERYSHLRTRGGPEALFLAIGKRPPKKDQPKGR